MDNKTFEGNFRNILHGFKKYKKDKWFKTMTKEEMFNDNIKLAYKIANKYKVNNINEQEDIEQVALIGLWKAVLNYNMNKRNSFSVFAYKCIENEVLIFLRKNNLYKSEISIYTPITCKNQNLLVIDTLLDPRDFISEADSNINFKIILTTINSKLKLTKREKEVLILTTFSKRVKDISKILLLTKSRVYKIKKNINKKAEILKKDKHFKANV